MRLFLGFVSAFALILVAAPTLLALPRWTCPRDAPCEWVTPNQANTAKCKNGQIVIEVRSQLSAAIAGKLL
jgi:hypothetical protein